MGKSPTPSPTFQLGGGGEPCTLCGKTVYPAERQRTNEGIYHFKCFTCTKCKRQLQASTFCEDHATGRLYCRPHYDQLAKQAGLDAVAKGGIDAAAGVLLQKKRKADEQEELDEIVEGASVWVELCDDATEKLRVGGSTEPFVRARVTSVADGTVGVRREAPPGKKAAAAEAAVPQRTVMLAEPEGSKVNNLQLLHLNEPNLLSNIKARFEEGQIYTYTGQLELLAVNPYEADEGR